MCRGAMGLKTALMQDMMEDIEQEALGTTMLAWIILVDVHFVMRHLGTWTPC